MAIQQDDDRDAALPGPAWSDVLTPSDLGPRVFDVRWDIRPRLRRWLAAHDLPTAHCREPHVPAVDAWALLDGGVISVSSVGMPERSSWSPPLSSGMRVLGDRAFRLLVAELALAGPATAPAWDPPVWDPDVLRAEFEHRVTDLASREQAELLATCTDGSSVRWVVGALAC